MGKTQLESGFQEGGLNRKQIIELRSSEVNEVLSTPPSWLIRSGLTVFFLVLLLMLSVTWFVRYPDLIKDNLKVVSQDLPKTIVSKTDGKLVKLFVKDGQSIVKDQPLAFLESTANHFEVMGMDSAINRYIDMTARNEFENIYRNDINNYYHLGELQKSYQTFQEIFFRIKAFVGEGTYLKKKEYLLSDLNTLDEMKESLRHQVANTREDYELAEEEFERQKGLFKEKIISKSDYNLLMTKLLAKKQTLEQMSSSLKNHEINQNLKKQEILELEKTIIETKNNFLQSLFSLKSEIESWKQKYVIRASADGKVVFIKALQENQIIRSGQELLYTVTNDEHYYGEMNIGQYNFGKVKLGQPVIVKFQSFPFEEFGTVNGVVYSISDLPKDSTYYVRINLPEGNSVVTNANKRILLKNGMLASAEIITEDRRLIERFFKEVTSNFSR